MLSHFFALLDALNISATTFVVTIVALCIPPLLALFAYEQMAAKQHAAEPRGCRRLGLNVSSNLSNEFDPRFAEGFPPSAEESADEFWRVKSLWVYPIKSCKGVELGRTDCFKEGMAFDRQFTFAQLKDGKWQFLTQRECPKLSNISLEVWQVDQSINSYDPKHEDVLCEGVLMASFPAKVQGVVGSIAKLGAALKGVVPQQTFRIPFKPGPEQIAKAGFKQDKVTIWKETVTAFNMSTLLPKELNEYLGIKDLALFRVDGQNLREVYRNAPTKEELGYQPVTGFQDAYPLHIINLASVRAIESEMSSKKRLSARAFRANIIVTGPEAYDEDEWKRIKIGWYEFDVSARCARCKMPNIDQETGAPNWGCFGMQMVPCDEMCQFKVGDEVIVLERGEHKYIPQ